MKTLSYHFFRFSHFLGEHRYRNRSIDRGGLDIPVETSKLRFSSSDSVNFNSIQLKLTFVGNYREKRPGRTGRFHSVKLLFDIFTSFCWFSKPRLDQSTWAGLLLQLLDEWRFGSVYRNVTHRPTTVLSVRTPHTTVDELLLTILPIFVAALFDLSGLSLKLPRNR